MTYQDDHGLVPIHHFNWKYNEARKNYSAFQLELLGSTNKQAFRMIQAYRMSFLRRACS